MSTTPSTESSGSAGSNESSISESRPSSSIASSTESIITTNTSSHTLIHRSSTKSLPERHVSSSTGCLKTKISFAPLPDIEPREGRSSNYIKLGVSARSEMMRQRRIALQSLNDNEPVSQNECEKRDSAWQDSLRSSLSPRRGELWQNQQRVNKIKSRDFKGEPDPLIAMAKLMKSAWKKVSSSYASPPLQSATSHDYIGNGGSSEKSDTGKASVDSDRFVMIEEHSQEAGNGDKESIEPTAKAQQFRDAHAHLKPNSYVLDEGEHDNGHVLRPSKPVRSVSEPHDIGSTIWPAA